MDPHLLSALSTNLITRAVRHRVLKWARFVHRINVWGIDFRSYTDWLARRQYVINVICIERPAVAERIAFPLDKIANHD